MSEVRARVPPRKVILTIQGNPDVDDAMDAAADALHAYLHAGTYDGGIALSQAMRALAEKLEPFIWNKEAIKT